MRHATLHAGALVQWRSDKLSTASTVCGKDLKGGNFGGSMQMASNIVANLKAGWRKNLGKPCIIY